MVLPGGGGDQSDSESEVSEAESGAGGRTAAWDSDSEGLEGQGWSSFLGGASPPLVQ